MNSERMQWGEAEAIVRLWRQKNGAPTTVSTESLAASLGVSEAQIRALREEVEAPRRPRFVDRSGLLSAGIAAVLLLVGAGFYWALRPASETMTLAEASPRHSATIIISPRTVQVSVKGVKPPTPPTPPVVGISDEFPVDVATDSIRIN